MKIGLSTAAFYGRWETEEAATKFAEQEMKRVQGIWIGELAVNDSIPEAAATLPRSKIRRSDC